MDWLALLVLLQQNPQPQPQGAGDALMRFLPFLAIIIVAYWLLIGRPQQKQTREREAMINSIQKGDKVVTIGGIHGTVVRVDKEAGTVCIKIAKGVEVDFAKAAVSSVIKSKSGAEEPGRK